MTLRRVVIVGSSGSGKSTLARAVADRLGVPHVELDALHWGPNWTAVPTAVLRERILAATARDGWVVDGNYSAARGDLWARADAVIWLDYPLHLIMWRLTRRTLRRCVSREVLWNGCRERFLVQLFTRESIFWWALTTWGKRRREYPAMLAGLAGRGVTTMRFHEPAEARRWLER